MPSLNHLNLTYYGDKDQIAEETQALYKQQGYHPLLSTFPMFIQLVLLIGVIGAVRELLSGTESMLSVYPSQMGGITLLMPLAAGCSALLLGLTQNHLNPLQREQTKASQWTTNGISIAISLMLGAFVPMGVGVYWIASNLLTILQQLLLNAIMPPEKYVDYAALAESRAELDKLNALSAKISPEDKRREKTDYKRFFSIANKHLVFYSEKSGFYKYFADVIEYLLTHSNVVIHYITSDPKDAIFEKAKTEPHIKPYYIGEKRLITLMMKMDAEMVVMTMPDLDNFHIKRSYVRKDIEYVYMFHGLISSMRTLRPHALDHYDTLFTIGNYMETEIREIEQITGAKEKKLIQCGYGVLDRMAIAYENLEKESRIYPVALIAPSWQADNILESCLPSLIKAFIEDGYYVVVRPHPQYIKRFPQKMDLIQEQCRKFPPERLYFELDFSSDKTVLTADILVTDWSSISYEYALATKKPVLFIDTPMKIVNLEYQLSEETFDLQLRKVIGISLDPTESIERMKDAIQYLLANTKEYEKTIQKLRGKIYHFGRSGEYGGKYILKALKERQKNDTSVHR